MNKIKLLAVMIIWGSLGVFTRLIPLSALNLAFLRAAIAMPVLLAVLLIRGFNRPTLRTLFPYAVSGVLLGFGWLTLFYGFKNTSVSTAVIIYNMCPVYVMIAAPFFLKEKVSSAQIIVICLSFIGLSLMVKDSLTVVNSFWGLLFSAISGMIYAMIVMINRSIKDRVDSMLSTFVQITLAMIVLLPFVLYDRGLSRALTMSTEETIWMLTLGVLHTGITYTLFFSVAEHMKSIEIVAYSYFEPLFGILLSVLILGEILTPAKIIGGVLIIGSTYIGEIIKSRQLVLVEGASIKR